MANGGSSEIFFRTFVLVAVVLMDTPVPLRALLEVAIVRDLSLVEECLKKEKLEYLEIQRA